MIAEPPPSSLVLVVSAFFEPGELSTRELDGTACQEELCVEVRFLFFLWEGLLSAPARSAQRPFRKEKKKMNLPWHSHYLSVVRVKGEGGPTPATSGGHGRQNKETATRNEEMALFDFLLLLLFSS